MLIIVQVTVQTESERQIDKLRRKEERKHRRGTNNGVEDDLSAVSFSSLLHASEKKNIFEDLIGHGEGPNTLGPTALPQGTIRKHYKGYEEVIIPPTPTASMKPGERLVFPSAATIVFLRLLLLFQLLIYFGLICGNTC